MGALLVPAIVIIFKSVAITWFRYFSFHDQEGMIGLHPVAIPWRDALQLFGQRSI